MTTNTTMSDKLIKNNMKYVELTIVLKAGCDVYSEIDKITAELIKQGWEITYQESEGIKTLPYSINGEERAFFAYMYMKTLDDTIASGTASWLTLEENVLRFLLVHEDMKRCKDKNKFGFYDDKFKALAEGIMALVVVHGIKEQELADYLKQYVDIKE